ncbi:MAG: hypothetical protein OEZ58_05460 [Gammaproteobacteria bacterium]|nr:hypothetical protein [Gammaproteobacteria bacterium]
MATERQFILKNFFQGVRNGFVEKVEDGKIYVADKANLDVVIPCLFLRTSSAAAPAIKEGDEVVYNAPESPNDLGCVLGLIEPYQQVPEKLNKQLKKNNLSSLTTIEDEVVRIKADKGLVIECGKSTIILIREGKVQIKGNELLSRARGMNKIKGAGVNIN